MCHSGVRRRWACAALLLVLGIAAEVRGEGFSEKPLYIDPRLAGWVEPLRTLTFQVGGGELYYVAGIYLGRHRDLNVICRSKISLRRFEAPRLQRFAEKLATSLLPAASDLARKGQIEGVVMTFYSIHLAGNVMALDIYDSCIAAQPSQAGGPIVLCCIERRTAELQPP